MTEKHGIDYSEFTTTRRDGWTLTVRKPYSAVPFLSLITGNFSDPQGPAGESVRSSRHTRVQRFTVNRDDPSQTFYSKEYLDRSVWDLLKHLFRTSRAKRAFRAGLMLCQNGLHTPEIVALAEKRWGPFGLRNILITKGLGNTQPLARILCGQEKDLSAVQSRQRRQQIRALGKTIGRMHAAGIFHGDLRGNNILVRRESDDWRFYLIDNERTRKFQTIPFSLRIKNLVQLNMLRRTISDTDRMRFLKAYCREAGLEREKAKKMSAAVGAKTVQRLAKRTRTHTEGFVRIESGDYRGHFSSSFFGQEQASDFPAILEAWMSSGQPLKEDRSTRVVRCCYRGREIVIKRYNYQGLWHSLRHTVKGSRAIKCWRWGHLLRDLGIPCARPLAYMEMRKAGIIHGSYIVNEFVEGPMLYTVMNTPDYSSQQRKSVMEQAGRLLKKLGQCRITHGDMKPANLLICCGRPVLIDLDSMQRHRFYPWFQYQYRKMVCYFYRRMHGKKRNT